MQDHFLRIDNGTRAMERDGPTPGRCLQEYLGENCQEGTSYGRVFMIKTLTVKPGEGHPSVHGTVILIFPRI